MHLPRILLDASVLKHAVRTRVRESTESKTVRWGGEDVTVGLSRWTEHSTADLAGDSLRPHIGAIPRIAHLAKRRRIELLVHAEAHSEIWGLPGARDRGGAFQGAPISPAPDPVEYSRVVVSGFRSAGELRYEFLDALRAPRFLELQKVTGANNPGPRRVNQLADAFHIWVAEEAGADFLLTTDLKLVGSASANRPEKPKVQVVAPLSLIAELERRGVVRIRDRVWWHWYRLTTRAR